MSEPSVVPFPQPPQLLLVDDAVLAASCAKLVPAFEWATQEYAKVADRKCVVIGRAGDAGALVAQTAAERCRRSGAAEVKTVIPEAGREAGWGLDHALAEHWDRDKIIAWLRANAKPFKAKKHKNPAELWAEAKLKAEERRKQNPKYPIWDGWNLQLGSNGGPPLTTLSNAVVILENDPALAGLVWFDEFLGRLMTGDPAREWGDADDSHLQIYMQRDIGITRIGRDVVSQAVLTMAHRHPRNCVRDWFDSLAHDGVERIGAFFSDYFGAEDNEYTRSASRNFWLSMVARIYSPGCKVDNMIVLEGAQGLGKSTALQIIGGDWFAEQHESATNPKGFAEILQGKMLVEISEMDAFNRAEVNRVKQTVSCPADRYRPSYGHHAKDHPRQCVFVGTTNRNDWNRDDTGARRFWPIACKGTLNLDAVRSNREQLFAEAVARYKAGEPHWHMPEDHARAEQEARFQGDPWLETVAEVLKGESKITTNAIAEKIGIPVERRDRATEMRIGSCLRFLGWHRRRGGAADRAYYYFRDDAAS